MLNLIELADPIKFLVGMRVPLVGATAAMQAAYFRAEWVTNTLILWPSTMRRMDNSLPHIYSVDATDGPQRLTDWLHGFALDLNVTAAATAVAQWAWPRAFPDGVDFTEVDSPLVQGLTAALRGRRMTTAGLTAVEQFVRSHRAGSITS